MAAVAQVHRLRREEYAELLKTTLEMDRIIATHSAIMDEYDPKKKVALVVDEWGAWYAPLPGTNPGFLAQQNSLRDAILAALNLNIFARHADRVRMTNIAQMVNVLQAMILTDKEKMLLTPTYHVFKMYVPFQDATFLPVTFDAGWYTTARHAAARRRDCRAGREGKIWLALTNLDPNRAPTSRSTSPALAGGTALSRRRRSAQAVDSVNSLRGAEYRDAEADHGKGRGRPPRPDARAQVGDGRLGGIASGRRRHRRPTAGVHT